MDWDDEYDNGYDDMGKLSQRDGSMPDKSSSEGGFDPMDIANPVSAYFFAFTGEPFSFGKSAFFALSEILGYVPI